MDRDSNIGSLKNRILTLFEQMEDYFIELDEQGFNPELFETLEDRYFKVMEDISRQDRNIDVVPLLQGQYSSLLETVDAYVRDNGFDMPIGRYKMHLKSHPFGFEILFSSPGAYPVLYSLLN